MNHHMLPEVFVGGEDPFARNSMNSTYGALYAANLQGAGGAMGGMKKKPLAGKLAPIAPMGLEDDYEQSYQGYNSSTRQSSNTFSTQGNYPQAPMKRHGQLAPINFK